MESRFVDEVRENVGCGKRFGCAADFASHQLSIAESFAVAPLLRDVPRRRGIAIDYIDSAIVALRTSRWEQEQKPERAETRSSQRRRWLRGLRSIAATDAAIDHAKKARQLVHEFNDDGAERYLAMAQKELRILQRE